MPLIETRIWESRGRSVCLLLTPRLFPPCAPALSPWAALPPCPSSASCRLSEQGPRTTRAQTSALRRLTDWGGKLTTPCPLPVQCELCPGPRGSSPRWTGPHICQSIGKAPGTRAARIHCCPTFQVTKCPRSHGRQPTGPRGLWGRATGRVGSHWTDVSDSEHVGKRPECTVVGVRGPLSSPPGLPGHQQHRSVLAIWGGVLGAITPAIASLNLAFTSTPQT